MKDILDNTLCFTHGGKLAGLYGILATGKLSSNDALERAGDNVFKFTDPNNEYKQEDGYLFFESVADRDRINYASLVDFQSGQTGFAFLLVASSNSLLNQVDILGNSDGILMGRSDNQPLEIDLKKVDYKILIPDSYKEMVEKYCNQLRDLGIEPKQDNLIFKPKSEFEEMFSYKFNITQEQRQKNFCEQINLNAQKSKKSFSFVEKVVQTKTSSIVVSCDSPLPELTKEEREKYTFNNAQDLLNHMKKRPTTSNCQRNTMLLFSEYTNSSLRESISKIAEKNRKPLIFDIVNQPEDLAFCLNNLAQLHSSREKKSNGEVRISHHSLYDIKKRLSQSNEDTQLINGLLECLDVVLNKDITSKECIEIIEKNKIPDPVENLWVIAINRQQQPLYVNDNQVKEIMKNNPYQEVLLWKQGMSEWVNALTMQEFMSPPPPMSIISPPLTEVVKNIKEIRENQTPNNANKLKIT